MLFLDQDKYFFINRDLEKQYADKQNMFFFQSINKYLIEKIISLDKSIKIIIIDKDLSLRKRESHFARR